MLSRVLHPLWPACEFLYSERQQFIYCPIPKVACSSLKHWFRALEGLSETAVQPDIHAALRAKYSLSRFSRRRCESILQTCELKVAFVRNPWDRVASAFLNKFVPGKTPALRALARRRQVADSRPSRLWTGMVDRVGELWPASTTALRRELETFTFRDFVHYLSSDDPTRLDKHWRPQHLFMGGWSFDFVGRFETLAADFALLCDRLGVPARLPHRNRTVYAAPAPEGCFADCPILDLSRMPALPAASQLFTPDLATLVGRVYRQDAQQFGYQYEPALFRAAA